MNNRTKRGVAAGLALLLAFLPLTSRAQAPVAVSNSVLYANYDLDSTTAISCSFGIIKSGVFESGAFGVTSGRAVTSGSNVTTTSTTDAFANVAVGDPVWAVIDGKNVGRYIATKASAASVTVNTAWNLGTGGKTLTYQNSNCGANSGWFSVNGAESFTVTWEIVAMAVSSGGVAVRIEERSNPLDGLGPVTNIWPGVVSADAKCGSGTFATENCVYTSATRSGMVFTSAGVLHSREVRLVFLLTGTDDADSPAEQITGFIRVVRSR